LEIELTQKVENKKIKNGLEVQDDQVMIEEVKNKFQYRQVLMD